MNILMLGAPGVGKGTQAKRLAEKHGFAHIAPGDILRKELKGNTVVGMSAKQYMLKGQLVPDSVVIDLISRHIEGATGKKGVILDGFPRNIPQADALDVMFKERQLALDGVIYFECPQKIIVDRVINRRVCSQCATNYHLKSLPPKQAGKCDKCNGALIQRSDDNESVVVDRHEEYEHKTMPLVQLYEGRGQLKRIDANRPADTIFSDLERALGLA